MSNYTFRLAEERDADMVSRWVSENPQISLEEVRAGSKEQNPSTLYFIVERDGVPVVFAPVYPQWTFAHLGFSPESSAETRKQALRTLVDGTIAMALQMGNVRELTALTLPEFPVAQYAVKQLGFEWESRRLIRLDINKLLPKQP